MNGTYSTFTLFILLIFFIAQLNSYLYNNPLKCKFSHLKRHGINDDSINSIENEAQTLIFKESSTGVEVVLIGSMHYNPHSIKLTREIVTKLAKQNSLDSVIIESCDIRWNKTTTLTENKIYRFVFDNEMQAASDTAKSFNCPVILGDQLINITNSEIKSSFVLTLKDFFQPFSGGWQRIISDVSNEIDIPNLSKGFLSTGNEGKKDFLGVSDLLDYRILLSAPISLVRYPLAIVFRSPILAFALIAFYWFSFTYSSATASTDVALVNMNNNIHLIIQSIEDTLVSLLLVFLEGMLLSRVFLIAILSDRNKVLAESILARCRVQVNNNKNDELQPKKKVVVAVLGMAHWNGVKKLLTEMN